ncbi:DNA-directed RNA polymerase V subunit 5C-like isoform X1 [Malus sylvestris]|uniref:DNA-directed RNA polymerase V subunit 5C-like isoform X1 n=1 Tax=Malus sylvestris TaxID=3752 RepID=UPI0021AC2095|nr:DNA-directed RNA polymerase V subunit 5C-like isoform X1 [Malus sylvestris]
MAIVKGDGVVPGSDGGSGRPGCITSHVAEGSVESTRFYLCRRTVMEMLRDRGCNVSDLDLNLSLTEFLSEFGPNPDHERLSVCVHLRSKPSKKLEIISKKRFFRTKDFVVIVVIFCGTDEIRKRNMCGIYAGLPNKASIHQLILVLQSKMNCYARKELEKYPFKVDTFHISDLLVNITKHVSQPKLEMLTAEEKMKLLMKYNLEDKKLPLMLATDATARYYGLEKGQVVKVNYSGGFAGPLETYRCVA